MDKLRVVCGMRTFGGLGIFQVWITCSDCRLANVTRVSPFPA